MQLYVVFEIDYGMLCFRGTNIFKFSTRPAYYRV